MVARGSRLNAQQMISRSHTWTLQEVFLVSRVLQGDAQVSTEPMTNAKAQQVVTSFLAGAGPDI